jgi:hypothetical protein
MTMMLNNDADNVVSIYELLCCAMQKNKRCEMRLRIFEGRAHVSGQRANQ